MFKYLLGRARVNDKDGDTLRDTVLAITRRCDSYQHVEMAQDVRMIPFNGGFCNSGLNPREKYFPSEFNGESISCQVKTDQLTLEQINEDLTEHDIYVAEFRKRNRDGDKYLVGIFLSKGCVMADPMNSEIEKVNWEKKTPEEFCVLFREVFDDPYYF